MRRACMHGRHQGEWARERVERWARPSAWPSLGHPRVTVQGLAGRCRRSFPRSRGTVPAAVFRHQVCEVQHLVQHPKLGQRRGSPRPRSGAREITREKLGGQPTRSAACRSVSILFLLGVSSLALSCPCLDLTHVLMFFEVGGVVLACAVSRIFVRSRLVTLVKLRHLTSVHSTQTESGDAATRSGLSETQPLTVRTTVRSCSVVPRLCGMHTTPPSAWACTHTSDHARHHPAIHHALGVRRARLPLA